MSERFSCARHSRDRREPLHGTASTVRRWVLIEQPGPWGRDALPESNLGADLGAELKARIRRAGARPLLIRRGGGVENDPRTAYLCSSAAGWLRRVEFDDPEQLLDLDLDVLAADEPVGGEPVDGPLLLTCTNGKHDACCAEMGRPVAEAFAAAAGDGAWEVSHIGGDRFAANVLWLPVGVYYGRIAAEDAALVAALAATGRLSLPHYRGRSTMPFAAQAAEVLLRRELSCDGIDALELEAFASSNEAGRATFRRHDERWEVRFSIEPADQPQQLTCRANQPRTPPRYRDVRFEQVSPGT
ncbi:MAG: sucrase ferredoxin [Nitriliruptorales bacterium]|nr:sucrase ferredoxin [Nitriliruptorales bacterium]